MRRLFVLFIFLSLVLPITSFAQTERKDDTQIPYSRQGFLLLRKMENADKNFNQTLEKLLKGEVAAGPVYVSLVTLRSYYPDTSFYNPNSEELVNQLMQYAFLHDTEESPVKASQALINYDKFLNKHLADIQVVYMAYNLSKQDASFGNTVFLEQVLDILESVILPEGKTGEQPENAFVVNNFGEKTFIMQALGVKSLSFESFQPSLGYTMDVHNVKNNKTGEEYPLFFNVSVPYEALKNREILEKQKQPIVPKL